MHFFCLYTYFYRIHVLFFCRSIFTEYLHFFCLQKYFYRMYTFFGLFVDYFYRIHACLLFVEVFLRNIYASYVCRNISKDTCCIFLFFCSSISHVHQPIHKITVHVQKYFSCPLVFTYPQKYCSCLEVFLQSFASTCICLQKYFSGLQKYSFYIQKEFSSFYNFFFILKTFLSSLETSNIKHL